MKRKVSLQVLAVLPINLKIKYNRLIYKFSLNFFIALDNSTLLVEIIKHFSSFVKEFYKHFYTEISQRATYQYNYLHHHQQNHFYIDICMNLQYLCKLRSHDKGLTDIHSRLD